MKPLAIPANHGVMGQQEKHSVSIANSVCSINNLSRASCMEIETACRLPRVLLLISEFNSGVLTESST